MAVELESAVIAADSSAVKGVNEAPKLLPSTSSSAPNIPRSNVKELDPRRNNSLPSPPSFTDAMSSSPLSIKGTILSENAGGSQHDGHVPSPLHVNTDDLIIGNSGGLSPLTKSLGTTPSALTPTAETVVDEQPETNPLPRIKFSLFPPSGKREKVSGAADHTLAVYAPDKENYSPEEQSSCCCCCVVQ